MIYKNKIKLLKLYLATVMITYLILMSWKSFYSLSCFALVLPIFVLFIISQGYIEKKVQERLCIKKCFFIESSVIATLLSSRILIILLYTLLSVLMTLSMMHGIIEYSLWFWLYIPLHIGFVILLYYSLNNLFRKTLKDNYRSIFARQWTFNLSSVLFVICTVYLEYEYGYIPSYLSDSLQTTIINASATYQSDCQIINFMMKAKVEIDSIFWWMINENTNYFNNGIMRLGIWLGFLFFNSLALLGISKLIVQIVYLVDKLFIKFERNSKNEA